MPWTENLLYEVRPPDSSWPRNEVRVVTVTMAGRLPQPVDVRESIIVPVTSLVDMVFTPVALPYFQDLVNCDVGDNFYMTISHLVRLESQGFFFTHRITYLMHSSCTSSRPEAPVLSGRTPAFVSVAESTVAVCAHG